MLHHGSILACQAVRLFKCFWRFAITSQTSYLKRRLPDIWCQLVHPAILVFLERPTRERCGTRAVALGYKSLMQSWLPNVAALLPWTWNNLYNLLHNRSPPQICKWQDSWRRDVWTGSVQICHEGWTAATKRIAKSDALDMGQQYPESSSWWFSASLSPAIMPKSGL